MDIEKFDKYRNIKFWFKNAKRIFWNGEPIRTKSKDYRTKYPNMTLKSLDTFSAVDFDETSEAGKKVDKLNATVGSIEHLFTDDYKSAFWLLNGGSDAFRVLGKEFTAEMAIQNFADSSVPKRKRMLEGKSWEGELLRKAHLSRKKTQFLCSGTGIPADDADKDEMEKVMGRTTVGDFVNFLSAERIAGDPRLVLTLVSEKDVDASKLSKLAKPILVADGKKYYDPAFVLDDAKHISPRILDGTKEIVLGKDVKLKTAQDEQEFDEFMTRLGKNLKVKLIPNASMNAGDVTHRERSLIRNVGRSILDRVKYRLNYRKDAIEKSLEVQYSSRGSKEEQIYSVLKGMGNFVCARSFEDIEKSFGKTNVMGLPNSEEYGNVSQILKNAAACLAAAQLAAGFLPRSDDTQQLMEFFKLDAMKELAQIEEDNSWAVGMLGGIVANAMNNAFANGVVYEGIYEFNTNSKWARAQTFLSTMFSKKKINALNGVLTKGIMPTKDELDKKFGPEQKFDIKNLTDEQKANLRILVGAHLTKKFEDTEEHDLKAYQEKHEEWKKLCASWEAETDGTKKAELEAKVDAAYREYVSLHLKRVIYVEETPQKEYYDENYGEIFGALLDKECEDVVKFLAANPDLSFVELEEAVKKSLEDADINKNAQTRVDNATMIFGKMGMLQYGKTTLSKTIVELEKTRDDLDVKLKANQKYAKDNNFEGKLIEYLGRKDVSEETKKQIQYMIESLDSFVNMTAKGQFKDVDKKKDAILKKYESGILELEPKIAEHKYAELDAGIPMLVDEKEYELYKFKLTSEKLQKEAEQVTKNAEKQFAEIKKFVEHIPEKRKAVDLESAESLKAIRALVKQEILNNLSIDLKEYNKNIAAHKDEITPLMEKFSGYVIGGYEAEIKALKSEKDGYFAPRLDEIASQVAKEMKENGIEAESAEEAYNLYSEQQREEDNWIVDAYYDEYAVHFCCSVNKDFAQYFNNEYNKKYNDAIKKEQKVIESDKIRLQEFALLQQEIAKKGLSAENETVKKFDAEFKKVAAIIERNEAVVQENEKAIGVYRNAAEKIITGADKESEDQLMKIKKLAGTLFAAEDPKTLEKVNFKELEALAEQVEILNRFERRERDWKGVAEMVHSVQRKGLSLEETIKALENYKSGKEQTEQDKTNIKDFLAVYGYVAKLGDEVFDKEHNEIAELEENEISKFNAGSIREFEALRGWLHVEDNFEGINSLSEKLAEYNARPGATSRAATEINAIYLDLASKIIDSAAKDIENSSKQSGIEIGRTYIKLEKVNGYKDDMGGSKVMTKKLEPYMPKIDREKIEERRREKARARNKKYREEHKITYEELVMLEVLKTLKDYEFVDEKTKAKMKFLEIALRQAITPAKVGESEEAEKAYAAKDLSTREKAEIGKAAKILVEEIGKCAAECEQIEADIKGKKKLPKDLEELRQSVMLQAKKRDIKSIVASAVKFEGEVPKNVQDIVEEALQENEKEARAKHLGIKKSIVAHSGIGELFDLTIGLLDAICKSSLGITREERVAEQILGEFSMRAISSKNSRKPAKRADDNQRQTKLNKSIKLFRAIRVSEKQADDKDMKDKVNNDRTSL